MQRDLTLEQNIFLAKKTLVEHIYSAARLEGINVTFPETQTLLGGVNVGRLRIDEIQTIINLRDAWRFTLDNIDKPFTLQFVCKVNEHVARNESLDWSVLRYGNVSIGGVEYQPPVPIREEVERKIQEFLEIENVVDGALSYYLWAMRSQLFWDGNKRTSNICANKLLIENGKGVLMVQEKHLGEFNSLLSWYYKTNRSEKIKEFLRDKCLHGLEIGKNVERSGHEDLEL